MGICASITGVSVRSPSNTGPYTSGQLTSGTSSSNTTEGKNSTSIGGSSSSTGQFSFDGVSNDELFPSGRILPVPNLRLFTFTELRSATRNFRPDSVLGEGGFGKVFKGWVDDKTLAPTKCGHGKVIAVKKLNPESLQGFLEWKSEVDFLGRLSHPNLVKLLGYCWEERDLLLVYEFMAKGSLENHLFRRGPGFEPLSWALRLKIAIQAARGLAFLHISERQIIYRDFKASNVLLDSNFNAKLSDFGLAKDGPTGGDSHVTTRVMGTYGYAAPEYVATGHLYVKSDVYGFGVVLLEMLSGQHAHDVNRPNGQQNLVDWARPFLSERRKLNRLMDPRLEGQYPSRAAFEAAQLTLKCISADPKGRPSMQEVLEILEKIETMKSRTREVRNDHTEQPVVRNRSHPQAHAQHRSPVHARQEGVPANTQHRSVAHARQEGLAAAAAATNAQLRSPIHARQEGIAMQGPVAHPLPLPRSS